MNNWNSLSEDSRVWIYGSKRQLSEREQESILGMLDRFCDEWAAHGAKLNCGFHILNNQIIALGVDEKSAAASGCSIDTSVKVFQEIDSKFDLDLFNRLRTFEVSNQDLITRPSMLIKEALESGAIDKESYFIDTLVTTKGEFNAGLSKPISKMWLTKYL